MKVRFLLSVSVCFLFLTSSCLKDENKKDESLKYPGNCVPDPNFKLPTETEEVTLKSGVKVEKIGDDYVYLGDIVLSDKQLKLLDETGSMFPEDLTEENEPYLIDSGKPISPIYGTNTVPNTSTGGSKAVGLNPYQGMFWAMVRYTYGNNLSSYQKSRIADAIRYIESETNARFYNATGKPTRDPKWGFDYPYVEFMSSDVNNSHVGRIGGRQVINLYNFDRGTIVHEICHALGMFHEQSRADRDTYINVHYGNIQPGKRSNFNKETRNYYIMGAFDFNSVMLYSSYNSFAIDYSKPTMTKKDGTAFYDNNGLSEWDRRFINTFYLPYVAREDVCVELDSVVYDRYNNKLSEEDRIYLEEQLNRNRCSYPLR